MKKFAKKTYTKPAEVVRVPFAPKFPPSDEQVAIFDAKKDSKDNLGIDAGPGSGKSTTLKWLMTINPRDDGRAAMLAFSKAIVTEIEPGCAEHVTVSTAHSFGYKALAKRFGKLFVSSNKHKKLFQENFPEHDPDEADDEERGAKYAFMFDFCKLIDMLRLYLLDETDPNNITNVVMKFNLELDLTEELLDMVKKQIKSGLKTPNLIDFIDMLWIPIRLNLEIPQFDTVYVDERQDLNTVMIEYLFRMTKERLFYVGDERQSIFGFGGADPQSTQRLIEKFGGPQLPLKVCRRCGTDIVAFAQQVYPDGILPWKGSHTGEVKHIEEIDYDMPDGSMILCRRNAGLVRHAFTLLRKGRKAIIKGKDIGANLLKLVEQMKARNIIDLIDRIRIHKEKRIEKLLTKKGVTQTMIQAVEDECECLVEIAMGSQNLDELKKRIENLFDETTTGITLSSCHRSKGLEADMVTIVDFSRIRLAHDKMSKDDMIQERNLDFVARTRAKKTLHLLG